MSSGRPTALLLATSLAVGGPSVAQRPVLPFGLKPGRRDVGTLRLPSPDAGLSAWYPARCNRPAPDPADPCPEAPADTGSFPLLLFAAPEGRLVHADSVLAEYLASHGYVVAAPAGSGAGASFPSLDDVLESLRARVDVDSLRIAVGGRGAGVTAARDAARSARVRAMVEEDPPGGAGESAGAAVRRPPTLIVLGTSPGASPAPGADRLILRTPPGIERRRLVPAVTHQFLSAVLYGWGDSLPALAARFRRLGL